MSIRNEDVVKAVKKRPLVFGCAAVCVLALVAAYLRSGGLTEREELLAERTREGERQQVNIRNSALLPEHLQAAEQGVAAVERRALDPTALADNLQYFYQLEADLGVKLIDLRQGNVSAPGKDKRYSTISYDVAINGSYPQILRFLQQLENGAPLVRFTAVSLRPRAAAGQDDNAAANEREGPALTLTLGLEVLGQPS